MEIRINTLTLHNFKGVHGDKVIDFHGRNARIEGDNGTGKSTVFDAFTWLLFGKDHQGRDWTNFNIKPLDPATHQTVADLDYTSVEAELLVDGQPRRLRRVLTEDWVKPRGEAVRVLKGHTQAFFVDGVACDTKKAYDLTIHSLIDEDVFRIVTNPRYFIDDAFTGWQQRRKILLSVIGYDTTAVDGDFADLVAEMKGADLELFRKKVAAEKKAQRDALEKANGNITAWNAALPERPDIDAINAQIQELARKRDAEKDRIRELIAQVDASLESTAAANKALADETSKKSREMLRIKAEQDKYLADSVSAENQANRARQAAISDVEQRVAATQNEIGSLKARLRALRSRLEECNIACLDEKSRLTALGAKYEAEKAKAFTPDIDTVCPTCGRPYPQEDIAQRSEAARQAFLQERNAALKAITDRVPAIRAEIAAWEADIEKATISIQETEQAIHEKTDMLAALDRELDMARSLPDVDIKGAEDRARRSDTYRALLERIATLEAEIRELAEKEVSTKDLLADRQRYSGQLVQVNETYEREARPLLDALAVEKERQRILAMIAEEEERRRAYIDELARLERLEVRTLEYIKASVDACEGAINERFKDARWKMFDRTLDGGIVEMCEVTTLDGVPYRSMNDAARTICGLDVIRVLSEANSVQAPIFIDNAEGVTRSDFGTHAQIIRLVVTKGAPLTVTNE